MASFAKQWGPEPGSQREGEAPDLTAFCWGGMLSHPRRGSPVSPSWGAAQTPSTWPGEDLLLSFQHPWHELFGRSHGIFHLPSHPRYLQPQCWAAGLGDVLGAGEDPRARRQRCKALPHQQQKENILSK